MSELKTLYPTPGTAAVGGTTAELYPIKLRNAETYAALAVAVSALLAGDEQAGIREIELSAFSATHGSALTRLLADQTSLTPDQLEEITSVDAMQWLQLLMWNNMRDFNRALFETAASLPDGAKSISG